MTQFSPDRKRSIIQLTPQIKAHTSVQPPHHSALRSGFGGQPPNPRWNGPKVVAWKQGRQWRQALNQGKMVVRPSDSLLIPCPQSGFVPKAEAPKAEIPKFEVPKAEPMAWTLRLLPKLRNWGKAIGKS
jgi:hypothetical protein